MARLLTPQELRRKHDLEDGGFTPEDGSTSSFNDSYYTSCGCKGQAMSENLDKIETVLVLGGRCGTANQGLRC